MEGERKTEREGRGRDRDRERNNEMSEGDREKRWQNVNRRMAVKRGTSYVERSHFSLKKCKRKQYTKQQGPVRQ